jgi:predicted MFS family arabinose efflux permease
MEKLASLSGDARQYLLVTGNYWVFTLTDGALRMLLVLHFYQLGYTPLELALLFVFYEVFGVITNLLGGWLAANFGLNTTMNAGLALQVVALCVLLVPGSWLSIPLVMAAQAMSGIAKDLNKMSAKSAVRLLVPKGEAAKLYRWVAVLTGSKNTLKGVGFFLGGVLLEVLGFRGAIAVMAAILAVVWLFSVFTLQKDFGKSSGGAKFKNLFSKSHAVNCLSGARLFLFAARDVWFVVALPVYLSSVLGWEHWAVGAFLACWVIGYGLVQTIAPGITGRGRATVPDGKTAFGWAVALLAVPALIAIAITSSEAVQTSLILGLMAFGALFAVNSALHSFLIISYADEDGVSLDVGFYYMANAAGRLLGTVLSGWVFQTWGLSYCLWISSAMIGVCAMVSLMLPKHGHPQT